MLICLWIFFVSNTHGQTSFEQTNENEIFDVTFGKLISGAELPSFSNIDMDMLKFEMMRNQPSDGVPTNLKKSDGINNHDVLDKQSFEKDMRAISSETMPENIPLPALDKSLMIAAEKTTEEIAKEFREEEIMNSTGIGISQTDDSNIQEPVSEMKTFLHSVADGDAVEKLVRDSNFMPVKENSDLFELRTENSLEFNTFDTPVSNLKTVGVTNHTILNDLNYTTKKMPDSFIIWSNPKIFVEPVHITKLNSSREILSVKARDTFNSSIEFICMLPEVVFCVTDLLSSDSYQLRIIYAGISNITNFNLPIIIRTKNHEGNSYTNFNASIHFISDNSSVNDEIRSEISSTTTNQKYQTEVMIDSELHMQPNFTALKEQSVSNWNESIIQLEKAEKKSKMPVFIFMPHFEHNSYEIYIPEGKNKDSTIIAIIYFVTYLSDVEAKFSIESDPLQWFYLGEMETKTNANHLVVAIKLMMHDGADVDVRKTNNGQYKFQIKANQGSFETSTNINVEVLTFATKATSYSLDKTTISSASVTLAAENFTTMKVLADSEHHSATNSTDIAKNRPGVITVTVPNLEQLNTNTVTNHDSSDIKIIQTELAKDALGITEESLVIENFAGTFQSTIHDTEAVANTTESAAEKQSRNFLILRVKEIARHQLEAAIKESEIIPTKFTRNFENDDSTRFDPDNLDIVYYTSVLPKEGTSMITEIHEDALVTKIGQSYENSEFNEYDNNFSTYNQEWLPAAKKSTTAVVLSVQNDNSSFPSIPVGDEKILQDEFGASLMSMTTMSVPENHGNINNMHWSSFRDDKHFNENFQKSAQNFKTDTDNEININWNQSSDEKFKIGKMQRIQLAGQQANNDERTIATISYPEIIRTRIETKVEWSEEDEILDNDFRMNGMELQEKTIDVNFKTNEKGKYILSNEFRDFDILPDLDIIITANNMINPNDIIVVSVNSSALEIIPHRMQPGKTVFLAIRDAEKLDRDLLDDSVVLKITASQQKHPSVTSSKVINIMRDKNLNDEAPAFLSPEYDFHIGEGSITGQKVGQMQAEFMGRREHGVITYQLIGPGSELFAINDGTISVSCPSVLPCLDREQITAYHLLAIATSRNDLNSVPAIIRIHIDDRNDNGPVLETLQNEITVSNGRLTKPFVVKVKDNDMIPHNINEISIDGTASAFISLEMVRDDIYYGRLWSLPVAGIYHLNITARDPDGNIPEQKIAINVQVLNTVTRTHFKRAKYERTVNTEKLFKGNPIFQPELENAPFDGLRFVLLKNDPGWLSVDEYSGNIIVGDVPQNGIVSGKYSTTIAAVNRTNDRLITESVLILTVTSDNHVKKLFTKKLIVMTLHKDTTVSRQKVEVLPEHNKASVTIVRDSISAIDEQLHYIRVDKNAISNSYGMIIIDMKRLKRIRMLQFNLSSKEDVNDSAKVVLFLSSDPVEMEHEHKRQAQPRFILPWRRDMNIIPIKLAENSPEEYTIISLPAYNPTNGTKIMDLRLSGEMAQHFTIDGKSGDVQVVIPFDFETMEPGSHIFDLLLIAGEEPYDTVAVLRVEIIDVDDNSPKIAKFGDYNFENLTIPENSRPGTVLFKVRISDPDYLYGKTGTFNYALSGNGAPNFQVKKINDTVAVIVSPAADLDREKIEEVVVLLKVTDSGGNSDSVAAMITIIDVNDNVPVFIHNEYKIEAVENWPESMILTYVHAEDKDKGLNAEIRYSLSPRNNEYFEIDPASGLIRAKKALVGLARTHPYDFSVVASDQGTPSLSAKTAVSIHVLESTSLSHAGDDRGIHIVSPSVHFTLQLDENIAANDRVYSVRAKIGGFNEQFGRGIKYSVTPVDNTTDGGWLTIDTDSGDLFTLQELDHELQPAITVSLF